MMKLPIRKAPAGSIPLAGLLLASLALGCAQGDVDEVSPATSDGAPSATSGLRQQLAGTISPKQLNIVLITLDTLRADRLSSYGSRVQTPHLDRLASEGAVYTNASTTVPFTLPAHTSIMTGTYPPFHGVRENVGYYLGENNTTLAQMLGEAGWQTAGFVSAFVLDARWGIGRGFDHYYDDFDLSAFEDPNLGSVQRPGPDTIAAALGWLDQRERDATEQRPFFLWLHLYDAHDPYTPPEPFRSQYPGRPYDGEVAYTDSLVGGFVDELEGRGLLERSAIMVTSDHGEGLGDHGESFHGYFVYDSTIHVPLILRLPGEGAAGKRINQAVSHVDIAPTLLDLTGQEIPEEIQGRSLLTTLDETPNGEAEPEVYAESFYPLLHYGWAPLRSLRTATHKYIEAPSPEYFDLLSDPAENNNLASAPSKESRQMARDLRALAERIEEGAAAATAPDLDEQTLAQLRALGYVAAPGETSAGSYDPNIPRTDPKAKIQLHRKLMLAQGRASEGDDEAATRLLEEALEEDPNLLDAHQLLGSLELADRPEVAAGHFERALALDDQHKPSLFGLASAHHQLGKVDEALLGYRLLLNIAGQDSKVTLAIADIEVHRGELGAAEEALRQAAKPGAPALLFNRLGEVKALSGRPDEALQHFEEALQSNPKLSQPHFNLAILFEGQKDLQRARRQYEEAIVKAPKHYQAQFNLARLMGGLGDAQRERELLEQAIASKPDFAIGHFFLGKSLMDGQELKRAEEATRAGLEIKDDNPLGWYVLADILNRRGRPAESARALAQGKAVAAKP